MAKKNNWRWESAVTDIVIIDTDTKIPNKILQTHGNKTGLHGRTHIVNVNKKEYTYYYPGILDLILNIDLGNGIYLIPEKYAEFFEKWLHEQRLRTIRTEYIPKGLDLNKNYLEQLKEDALFDFMKDSGFKNVNNLRWFPEYDEAALDLLNKNNKNTVETALSKLWKIDWTKNKKITEEMILKYGINIDTKYIETSACPAAELNIRYLENRY
ncbi:hypothetical protein Metev_2338 (plasmid) [Methanohalobium evestigatum Z-7303]|uniref:Uncharacterized protein n=1 Tax=Methanohalobium evestigatum (strain ATCC BAA-1072 / DSM 3721 / NBRC 107634 / OCM 161 / Z-7303) TaxID=644295 RepID=D7EC28_METEZ|nr:hypothetical protein [Methanohalobium evestigatum]ADI75150.1 hypothetical protein Metev_2338 [Methanohalobium evestigatum Z-7303]